MIDLKITGLDGALELLRQLPPETVSKNGGVVKLALRSGARIVLQKVKQNIAATATDSGLLAASMHIKRTKPPPGVSGERVSVRSKAKAYDNPPRFRKSRSKRRAVTTHDTLFFLEAGRVGQPAQPVITPVLASSQEIVDAVSADLVRRIDRIVKKLEKSQ